MVLLRGISISNMEEIMFNLKDMNIVHYEIGNVRKNAQRPVCALMLEDANSLYKVKVLFKGTDASKIDGYMINRKSLGHIGKEKISLTGKLREVRKDCIVIDNTKDVYFDIEVGI